MRCNRRCCNVQNRTLNKLAARIRHALGHHARSLCRIIQTTGVPSKCLPWKGSSGDGCLYNLADCTHHTTQSLALKPPKLFFTMCSPVGCVFAFGQMLREMQDEQRAMNNNPAEKQAEAHASAVKRFTGGGFAVN